MSHIAGLPCDILKIDRSFVNAMLHERKSMALVQAMIQLAHDPGLQAVAEGGEHRAGGDTASPARSGARVPLFQARPLDQLLVWLFEREERGASRSR